MANISSFLLTATKVGLPLTRYTNTNHYVSVDREIVLCERNRGDEKKIPDKVCAHILLGGY